MTAPRKPVAWISPNGTVIDDELFTLRVSGIYDIGDLSGYKPLYTAPNLQALWALVEEWEAISKTHTSQLVREAHADFASELRATLEAL